MTSHCTCKSSLVLVLGSGCSRCGLPVKDLMAALEASLERSHVAMPLAQFLAEYRPGGDWRTWDEAEKALLESICLCCGQPGHYQQTIEAHLAANGLTEGVYVGGDGRLRDGHHRVIAARRLGIDAIPLETAEQAQERWIRDHGHVDWRHRKAGDVPDYATLHWCTAALEREATS